MDHLHDQHGDGVWGLGERKNVTPSDTDLIRRQEAYEAQRELDDEILFPGDVQPAASGSPSESSGGDNDYWLLTIHNPKRLAPYEAECEDIIEALEMTFQEGEAFKAIWRKCGQRLGNGKPGNTALRDAQKVEHFGKRMVAVELNKLK